MLKVAMIGKWHVHADGYAKEFNSQEDSRVACVWDDDKGRGEAWAADLNVPFYSNIDELFNEADFDAVCVCCTTNMHKEAMLKAAKNQKHIFTEKVMCLTSEDCEEVSKEIKDSGVVFTISFPHRCMGRNLFIKEAIDSGKLGNITLLRIRNCHDGALKGWLPEYWYNPITTGGGAMMDLGAHPMYLSTWMLGKPISVQSRFKMVTGREVDDDAVSVLGFEGGATALVETSLVAPFTPQICEVYGTKGAILSENDHLKMRTNETDGWVEPKLPENLPSPIRQFTDSVLYNKPTLFGTDEATLLTKLMERAYEANATKSLVSF